MPLQPDVVQELRTLLGRYALPKGCLRLEVSDAARAAIKRHVHAELRRDMSLTPRPLFAEIARGVDSDA